MSVKNEYKVLAEKSYHFTKGTVVNVQQKNIRREQIIFYLYFFTKIPLTCHSNQLSTISKYVNVKQSTSAHQDYNIKQSIIQESKQLTHN